MAKTKAKKITAEEREHYPLNNSMQARVSVPIRAATALKRVLDIAHRHMGELGADLAQGVYQEMYEEAMRHYKLMQHACRGTDREAIAEFFPGELDSDIED